MRMQAVHEVSRGMSLNKALWYYKMSRRPIAKSISLCRALTSTY